jgi:ADP-heptose:LPS heptosyltransferase
MHLASALDKPILCFFGDSPPSRWHPWKTHHELLQAPNRDVRDLSVEQALAGFERLMPMLSRVQPRS